MEVEKQKKIEKKWKYSKKIKKKVSIQKSSDTRISKRCYFIFGDEKIKKEYDRHQRLNAKRNLLLWIIKSTTAAVACFFFRKFQYIFLKPELPHGLCNRPYVNFIFRFVYIFFLNKRHFRSEEKVCLYANVHNI